MQASDMTVVIPALHEGPSIAGAVAHVKDLGAGLVVVADGAVERDTLAALHASGLSGEVACLAAPRGRARQMNAGARLALALNKNGGNGLLFLHADTRLPPNGLELAARALTDAAPPEGARGLDAGAFGLGFAPEDGGRQGLLRVLAGLADLRNRATGTPYGDQAQFFRAEVFHAVGGFADLPLMEDVEVMPRLRRLGYRTGVLSARVGTSARRYRHEGVLRRGLANNLLRLAYGLGVHPARLSRHYLDTGPPRT